MIIPKEELIVFLDREVLRPAENHPDADETIRRKDENLEADIRNSKKTGKSRRV